VPEPTADRPWLAAYPPGVPADAEVPDRPVTDLLERAARDLPGRVAVDFRGRRTTYAELAYAVDRAAQVLRERGTGRGDRVALALPACPQHVVAFHAVLRTGAAVVEHDPLVPPAELAERLRRDGDPVVVAWDRLAARLGAARRGTGGGPGPALAVRLRHALPLHRRLVLGLPRPGARSARGPAAVPPGWEDWDLAVAAASPVTTVGPGPRPDDPAVVLPGEPDDGAPGAVVLSHRNLRAAVEQALAWTPGLRWGRETVLAALPLSHVCGLTLGLGHAAALAATLVLPSGTDAGQVLADVRRTRATVLLALPPVIAGLTAAAEGRHEALVSLRHGFTGGRPLPADVAALWERLSGSVLVEGLGTARAAAVTVANPPSPARRLGTVGVPLPSTEARVVDPDAPSVPRRPGEAGELLLRGPQVPTARVGADDAPPVVLADGWLRTGQVAVMSGDGFLTVVDPLSDVVRVAGSTVYPSEVEEVLREHPGVADAAVVGIGGHAGPDGTPGAARVAAAIVPAAGHRPDPGELRAWAGERLAGHQVPSVVRLVAALPRDRVGALRRGAAARLLDGA
jgi:long-chain acyl-CoA synthetase